MSSNSLVIRIPKDDEIKTFYDIYCTGLPGVDKITFDKLKKWWTRSKEQGTFEKLWRVAEINGKLVGIIINVVNKALKWGMIWELSVLPEWRSKGIGKELVQESEKLLLEYDNKISYYALGLKTHNDKALPFYERLGYNIHFIVTHLQKKVEREMKNFNIIFHEPNLNHLPDLLNLIPDAYWNQHTTKTWKNIIKEKDGFVAIDKKTQKVVGYIDLGLSDHLEQSTELGFHCLQGYGSSIILAALKLVKTENLDLWVQDNHQDILATLFNKGFRRIESEYLMKKVIKKV